MHRSVLLAIALSLAAAVAAPASAQEHAFTIHPAFGPQRGGTVVTIKGPFSSWPYWLSFGDEASVNAYRVDATTFVAITPPGVGTVPVSLVEGDMGIAEMEFHYIPDHLDHVERLLLPILSPPALGAHGSEFRTELCAYNLSAHQSLTIEGIGGDCPVLCIDPFIELAPRAELQPEDVVYSGNPGRFAYTERFTLNDLWLHLRVFDTSRSDDNYGTTIPVVRERDMFLDRPIAFAGIPTEPRFRNTLRIYGTKPATVNVEIASATSTITRQVSLEGANDHFQPAYAVIGDLPANVGPLRITIRPPAPDQGFGSALWAFVSVTNNETQMITVVTP